MQIRAAVGPDLQVSRKKFVCCLFIESFQPVWLKRMNERRTAHCYSFCSLRKINEKGSFIKIVPYAGIDKLLYETNITPVQVEVKYNLYVIFYVLHCCFCANVVMLTGLIFVSKTVL
jgi:hypothetical protein